VSRRARGRVALALALLLSGPAPAGAEDGEPRVESRLERNDATVGDRVGWTIEVYPGNAEAVEAPAVRQDAGDLAVTILGWDPPTARGEPWIWRGTVAAFRTGEIEVPSVPVQLTVDDEPRVLHTEALTLDITSVLAGEEDVEPADLKGVQSLAPDYTALQLALLVLAGLLAVSAGVWWLQRRYGRELAAAPRPDPFERLEPHVWVYRELQRLLESRLAEAGRVEEFCEGLSQIVKRYLGGRYRLELMERTTTEVVPALKQAGAEARATQEARAVLELCDRVKFARERLDAAACRAAVEQAYRIVDATRPAEAKPVEQGAA